MYAVRSYVFTRVFIAPRLVAKEEVGQSMTLLALATAQLLAFQAPATRTTLSKVAEAAAPLITAGVLAFATTVPAFADGNPSAGEVIFSGNCAACHAGGQNVIMPEKTLERQARACTSRLPE